MKEHMLGKGFLFAIALLLAGCAGWHVPDLSGSKPEARQVIDLIGYAQRIATMTAEQQRREYSLDNQAFARNQGAMSRMRLALLLATPGASVQDAARATRLIEPLARSGDAASPLHALAGLLYGQLNERVSEQKRADQMRQQLEALKNLERTMIERGQDAQPRRQ